MTDGFDCAGLTAAVAAYGPVVRVVIGGFEGSTPRETGTSMLVWPQGQDGTIGGGALELMAVAAARDMLRDGVAATVRRMPLGPALGQCCGGHVTLVLERFDAAAAAAVSALRAEGAAGYVREVDAAARELAAARVRRSSRSVERVDCGLIDGCMVEPFAEEAMPLWIYGAGHVGRAIVRVTEGLPLAVTWVDTAPDRFPEEIPPHVTRLVAAEPGMVVRHAPAEAVHLVMTYSHALDLEICHAVLGREFRHLGLIGSASKRARFRSRLLDLGHEPATVGRMCCPIGDRSLGKRPAAIALGVVREILQIQSGAAMRPGEVAT